MQIKTTTKLQTTLAVKLMENGRGLLSQSCWQVWPQGCQLAQVGSTLSMCVFVYIIYLYIRVEANGFSLYKFQAKNKRERGKETNKNKRQTNRS